MVPDPSDAEADSMSIILDRYAAKGYTAQFSSRPGGMVHCHACGEETPAEQVPMEALHRCEGNTNPDDMAVVAALECPMCSAGGTFVAAFGTQATAEDSEVLANLMDDRAHSGITPGL